MSTPTPGTAEWLAQVTETIIDPEQEIVDPHHHLWRRNSFNYVLDDLWADTQTGHKIQKTVFIECRANYRDSGPEHLRCVGETEFVAEIAQASQQGGPDKAAISAIVAHADLMLGDDVDEVLDAHEAAGKGLFRGIRHAGARDPNPQALTIPGRSVEGLYGRSDFQRGVRCLGARGLTYDTWHYHHQNSNFADLARAIPETTMILDHFGTPLGVGVYADKREEIFEQWCKDITEIAECPNVVAKLGGLAMPDNGFGWHTQPQPATSDELVVAQQQYYLHAIDAFGPERCMFESNFPVDKMSISYPILWNALKKIAAQFNADERQAMFYRTATRVYRLDQ